MKNALCASPLASGDGLHSLTGRKTDCRQQAKGGFIDQTDNGRSRRSPQFAKALTLSLTLAFCHTGYSQSTPPDAPIPSSVLHNTAALAQPAPPELAPYSANWTAKGQGTLRFFGFKAYDATLWLPSADATFSFARPFALDIRYATGIKGKDISNTSLIELQRLSRSSPEQITAWAAFMDATFTDVKSGDHLIGVHLPNTGVRFFLNGKLAGESADLTFSEAFFKIWLDPKTKRPELRNALLGQVADPKR